MIGRSLITVRQAVRGKKDLFAKSRRPDLASKEVGRYSVAILTQDSTEWFISFSTYEVMHSEDGDGPVYGPAEPPGFIVPFAPRGKAKNQPAKKAVQQRLRRSTRKAEALNAIVSAQKDSKSEFVSKLTKSTDGVLWVKEQAKKGTNKYKSVTFETAHRIAMSPVRLAASTVAQETMGQLVSRTVVGDCRI